MSLLTDLTLMAKVKAQLLNDLRVSGTSVKVEADDGRVTLFGNVPNMAVRQQVVDLVAQVDGVTEIRNFLTTGEDKNSDTQEAEAPAENLAAVADAIAHLPDEDPTLQGQTTAVGNADGTLVLSGEIASLAMKRRLENAAWRHKGVNHVINNIQTPEEKAYPTTPPLWERIRNVLLQVQLDELPVALQPEQSLLAERLLNLLLQRELTHGAQGLAVKASKNSIVLYGRVPTKEQEREILDLAEEVYSGTIENEIEVGVPPSRSA